MTVEFVISRDPRCRPHILRDVVDDHGRNCAVARCGHRFWRRFTRLDNVRGRRPVCSACRTAVSPGAYVYIARGRHGDPLYIGYTSHLYRRLRAHQLNAPWWPLTVEIESHLYAFAATAVREEAHLIATLRPRFNQVLSLAVPA